MAAQSQTAVVTELGAANFVWTQYYPTIVINTTAGTAGTVSEVFVRTDGTQAVAAAANNQAVSPNVPTVLGNQLPLPQAEGSNVLGLLNDPLHATQVSVIGFTASSHTEVTVTPQ